MTIHNNFILTPITDILDVALSTTNSIGDGIEMYALYDYIMQSVFLKMTGFQEQKLKCICWSVATIDYEYRHTRFTQNTIGGYSSYSEKNIIYQDLIGVISKSSIPGKFIILESNKLKIRKSTIDKIDSLIFDSNLSFWFRKDKSALGDKIIEIKYFAEDKNLFLNVLQDHYKLLYQHRNKCAHNTNSYQQNLPSLNTLSNSNYKYDNYYYRFILLCLIDNIITFLYSEFIDIDKI